MLRADLEAAGVPVEVDGRIADFHALRVTFITGLSMAGVHPRTAMELARHGSIGLTMSTYTRLELHDTAAAIAKLPNLAPAPESLVATGTEANSRESACAPICALPPAFSGKSGESRETGEGRKEKRGVAREASAGAPLRAGETAGEGSYPEITAGKTFGARKRPRLPMCDTKRQWLSSGARMGVTSSAQRPRSRLRRALSTSAPGTAASSRTSASGHASSRRAKLATRVILPGKSV